MSIACNELQQTINSLLISFKDCRKIKNSDLRKLVELSVALYACSNGGGGETGDIQHNATENIQGGSLFERFHLTEEQYNNLININLEDVFFPEITPNTTIQLGGVTINTTLANKTAIEILTQMLVVYLNPAFIERAITDQTAIVEIGTTISGTRNFTWSVSNGVNVKLNTIQIIDVTASNSVIGTALGNDGSESVGVTTIKLDANNQTQLWKLKGTNTNEQTFESSNIEIIAKFKRYFGATATTPTNSAEVKALTGQFQVSNGDSFILNTGTTNLKFAVALPPGRTIVSVVDSTINVNITSSYVLSGTINVVDAGETNRIYNLYEMTISTPYSSYHTHQITTI